MAFTDDMQAFVTATLQEFGTEHLLQQARAASQANRTAYIANGNTITFTA